MVELGDVDMFSERVCPSISPPAEKRDKFRGGLPALLAYLVFPSLVSVNFIGSV